VAACGEVGAACAAAGIEFVTGIEITAVQDETDVHMLGYFVDPQSQSLRTFLTDQRQQRVDRVRRIIERLAGLGIRLDADAILKPALDDPGRSVGRPWVARALIAAGYAASANEAFSTWLSRGRPGFVPREGAPPEQVIARIHDAGGLASMAHPVLIRRDDLIPVLAAAGMDAIEVYHTDHNAADTIRYRTLADRLNLAASGGSDYHADESRERLAAARGLRSPCAPPAPLKRRPTSCADVGTHVGPYIPRRAAILATPSSVVVSS
jgi:predicted metal-dependent phosphoesterase TrpH